MRPHMKPAWFDMVQGINLKPDDKNSTLTKRIFIGPDVQIIIERIEKESWQIIYSKKGQIINQVPITRKGLLGMFCFTWHLECSQNFSNEFYPHSTQEGIYIRTAHCVNIPGPNKHRNDEDNKNNVSIFISRTIKNFMQKSLDLK